MQCLKVLENENACYRYLISYLQKRLDRDFYLAISGGNSPKGLFLLMEEEMEKKDLERLKIFWVDERMVEAESDESNYGVFSRIMKDKLLPDNIHQIEYSKEPKEAVERYLLKLEQVPMKDNYPCFDLIVLGIGSDGHTASLFPSDLDLLASPDSVLATCNHATNQERVTLSMKVINNAKARFFLVPGMEKRAVVKKVLSGNKDLPASYVKKEGTLFLTDQVIL